MSAGITISQRLEKWAKLTDYTLTPGSSTRDGRPHSFTGRDVSAYSMFPPSKRFCFRRIHDFWCCGRRLIRERVGLLSTWLKTDG
ncbi:hypothetical protein EGA31_11100 [Mycobacterium avium subsp. paratuberculosis]|nr:hypothetical protein EGA31_11100 [Mycobacterium avium subsp. paratuberculosis]